MAAIGPIWPASIVVATCSGSLGGSEGSGGRKWLNDREMGGFKAKCSTRGERISCVVFRCNQTLYRYWAGVAMQRFRSAIESAGARVGLARVTRESAHRSEETPPMNGSVASLQQPQNLSSARSPLPPLPPSESQKPADPDRHRTSTAAVHSAPSASELLWLARGRADPSEHGTGIVVYRRA
jgi:hypothetical protein